jgi:hypothetical protein
MIYGMLVFSNCLLTDVADQLHESTKKINSVDCLSKHLEKGISGETLTSYLQTIKKWVSTDPVVHIDNSDIIMG